MIWIKKIKMNTLKLLIFFIIGASITSINIVYSKICLTEEEKLAKKEILDIINSDQNKYSKIIKREVILNSASISSFHQDKYAKQAHDMEKIISKLMRDIIQNNPNTKLAKLNDKFHKQVEISYNDSTG